MAAGATGPAGGASVESTADWSGYMTLTNQGPPLWLDHFVRVCEMCVCGHVHFVFLLLLLNNTRDYYITIILRIIRSSWGSDACVHRFIYIFGKQYIVISFYYHLKRVYILNTEFF